MSSLEDAVKLFAMTYQLLEHDLDKIEAEFGIDLERGHQRKLEADELYYPQIEHRIRAEAARMAPHYEMFYSLEKAVRNLIFDTLAAEHGANWWETEGLVPQQIKKDSELRWQKEIDSGMTPRSSEPLDFTTFGELGEIIKSNWSAFEDIFSSVKAVERVMGQLNTLRGPIAHCSPLADDEVARLRLGVRDWFRLMQ